MIRLIIAAVALATILIGTGHAADVRKPDRWYSAPLPAKPEWSGFVYTSFVNNALFANSGFKATKSAANMSVVELQHNPTGLYVNLFGVAPLREFNVGAEIDVRVGKRFECFGLDCDLSAAWYRFGVEGAGYWNAAATRFAVSKRLELGAGAWVTPHAYVDYQYVVHHLPLRNDNVSVQAGALFGKQFDAWLKPTLTVDLSYTNHLTHFTPRKGSIYAVETKLSVEPIKNLVVGPLYTVTVGAVDSLESNKLRHMYGAFALYKF